MQGCFQGHYKGVPRYVPMPHRDYSGYTVMGVSVRSEQRYVRNTDRT